MSEADLPGHKPAQAGTARERKQWSSPRVLLSDLAGTKNGGNQTTDLGTGILSKSPS